MLLRCLSASLALDEDRGHRAEARSLVDVITQAIPEGHLRATFLGARPVQRVLSRG
jgi:hypothetical protein